MDSSKSPNITESLVQQLIAQQFPAWSDKSIRLVECSGWDNRTFHLGDDMLVRLPSAAGYAAQVEKEQQWLPYFENKLPLNIPAPLAMGQASGLYPWPWSVYRWLPGSSINTLPREQIDLNKIALTLADFLNAFQRIDPSSGPQAGAHNYYRGAHPSVYGDEAIESINQLLQGGEQKAALEIWGAAMDSSWQGKGVWVHGDISSGNLLVDNGKLSAVIDFGCLGVGDPACDLMIAWTLFDAPVRETFKTHLDLDNDTWRRGKAWALWKCLQDSGPESRNRSFILTQLLGG